MTDERDYYAHHKTQRELGASSGGGGLWVALAILALLLLVAMFYLFSGDGAENGTRAPDMVPAPTETPTPAPNPAPIQ